MKLLSKTCHKCKAEKLVDLFSRHKYSRDGYKTWCKECCSALNKSEAYKQKRREYYAKNKDEMLCKMREYHEQNRDAILARQRVYYKDNKPAFIAYDAKRRAKQLRATPAWADMAKINEVYSLAQEFRESGIDVHVDHIIPLQGKDVSGLHVEHNLRVCLATTNLRKSNHEWRI